MHAALYFWTYWAFVQNSNEFGDANACNYFLQAVQQVFAGTVCKHRSRYTFHIYIFYYLTIRTNPLLEQFCHVGIAMHCVQQRVCIVDYDNRTENGQNALKRTLTQLIQGIENACYISLHNKIHHASICHAVCSLNTIISMTCSQPQTEDGLMYDPIHFLQVSKLFFLTLWPLNNKCAHG